MCKLSGLLCFRQVSGNRVAILFCLFWGIFIVHRFKMGFWESTDSISETTEIQEKHFPWQMIQNWYPSLLITGFPDSSAGKESSYNTGDSWVGKISWRRERLPTPIFWPGEFHALYSPWGHQGVGQDWATFTFTFQKYCLSYFALLGFSEGKNIQ